MGNSMCQVIVDYDTSNPHLKYCMILYSTENCLDRHARKAPDRVAIIWEQDEHGREVRMTYKFVN